MLQRDHVECLGSARRCLGPVPIQWHPTPMDIQQGSLCRSPCICGRKGLVTTNPSCYTYTKSQKFHWLSVTHPKHPESLSHLVPARLTVLLSNLGLRLSLHDSPFGHGGSGQNFCSQFQGWKRFRSLRGCGVVTHCRASVMVTQQMSSLWVDKTKVNVVLCFLHLIVFIGLAKPLYTI